MTQKKNEFQKDVKCIVEYEAKVREADEDYRNRRRSLSREQEVIRGKLDAARTRAVMGTSPYLAEALGIAELLNITSDTLKRDPALIERLKGCATYDDAFEGYKNAVLKAAEYLFLHPELKDRISGGAESSGPEAEKAEGEVKLDAGSSGEPGA